MNITGGISATKAGFELAKGLRELLKREQFDPQEVNARLLELQELLLDAQQSQNEAESQIRALQKAIELNEELRTIDADLEMIEGGMLVRKSQTGLRVRPRFCAVCWGSDRKLVALVPSAGGSLCCGIHDNIAYWPLD